MAARFYETRRQVIRTANPVGWMRKEISRPPARTGLGSAMPSALPVRSAWTDRTTCVFAGRTAV
jgi:hypothetical protein